MFVCFVCYLFLFFSPFFFFLFFSSFFLSFFFSFFFSFLLFSFFFFRFFVRNDTVMEQTKYSVLCLKQNPW